MASRVEQTGSGSCNFSDRQLCKFPTHDVQNVNFALKFPITWIPATNFEFSGEHFPTLKFMEVRATYFHWHDAANNDLKKNDVRSSNNIHSCRHCDSSPRKKNNAHYYAAVLIGRIRDLARLSASLSVPYGLLTRT